jgi:type IV secretion system protein TrbL
LATSTASELARGAGAVLKGKAVQLAESFQERMDQTVGGQVAAAIRARPAAEAPAFGGNSLAGDASGDPPSDSDDEVAAFVNRSTPA